jgi:hypothetical protein
MALQSTTQSSQLRKRGEQEEEEVEEENRGEEKRDLRVNDEDVTNRTEQSKTTVTTWRQLRQKQRQ